MASTVISNTGKAQPLRWLAPLLSASVVIVALLVAAAPASAESTEGGSGWTYSGEPSTETSESGVENGGSVGSGGGAPEQSSPSTGSPPPEEAVSEPTYEESEYTPGYSEYESEAVTPPTYEEPLEVAPIEPPPAPETKAPVAGGVSPALVPPEPLDAVMIDGAAPLPQESAHYSGPVVSSGKILLWLAIAAAALLLLAWPRLSRSTRPGGGRPTRLSGNGATTGTATAASPTVFASTRPRPGA